MHAYCVVLIAVSICKLMYSTYFMYSYTYTTSTAALSILQIPSNKLLQQIDGHLHSYTNTLFSTVAQDSTFNLLFAPQ